MGELDKPRTISERLSEAARSSFFGRRNELALLSDAIQSVDPPFLVAFIHGPGGIGKSRLIQALLSSVGSDVRHHVMDCRNIEPTPEGFLMSLGSILNVPEEADHDSIVGRLGESGQRTVLALDTYERFGLMDTWLRQVFVPSLKENVFTIIAGRQAPNPAWLTSPGWQGLFRELELRELSQDDAREMLVSRGLRVDQVERTKSFARGHPLALEMAAAAILSQPDLEITAGPPPKILQQLTQAFLAELQAETVEAIEATSVVRRVTEPLLRALLGQSNVRKVFDTLQALPFIDSTAEGLIFHDVVRESISKNLARRDPQRYGTYRRLAWHFFSEESHRTASSRGLWQYTADLLYMIENPVVREAFFPEGATDIIIEPAAASDGADILDIAKSSEPEGSIRLIEHWWERHPETFNIAKTQKGDLVAFYIIFEPDKVDRTLLKEDPFTFMWLQHLRENPVADGERVLFCRRWLDRTTGETPSPAVGACFLDIKRFYLELRPSLRRIYFPVKDVSIFEPILFPLGFGSLEEANVVVNGVTYYTLMNDFGPSSVDGWLAKVIGAELGVDSRRADETRPPEGSFSERGRILTTVLFTDIVGSTKRAVVLGDNRWRDLIERHHALVRSELANFRGREIDTAGDGFFAIFDSPAQAVECASSIRNSVAQLGIEIKAGLHLGECEATGGAVRGIAVHIGARVAAKAGPDEVLVSSTVKDAVAGSEIRFEDRGSHVLKGIPGEWRLYAVDL